MRDDTPGCIVLTVSSVTFEEDERQQMDAVGFVPMRWRSRNAEEDFKQALLVRLFDQDPFFRFPAAVGIATQVQWPFSGSFQNRLQINKIIVSGVAVCDWGEIKLYWSLGLYGSDCRFKHACDYSILKVGFVPRV